MMGSEAEKLFVEQWFAGPSRILMLKLPSRAVAKPLSWFEKASGLRIPTCLGPKGLPAIMSRFSHLHHQSSQHGTGTYASASSLQLRRFIAVYTSAFLFRRRRGI
jgi:hypothetical protein